MKLNAVTAGQLMNMDNALFVCSFLFLCFCKKGGCVQHYVIKFVSDLRQAGGTLGSSTNKTDNITEILLKVALYIIKQTNKLVCKLIKYYLI